VRAVVGIDEASSGRAAVSAAVRRSPSGGSLAALGNALFIAIDTLWAHKLRSSLTVFGIVVGIAAVVLVGAALEALSAFAVATTAQAFGTNTFLISQVASVGDLTRKQLSEKLRKNPEIYRREAEVLASRVTDAARVAPTLQSVADVKAGNRTFLAASIVGSTANLEVIRDLRLARGRFFSEEENRRALGAAVIGQDVADELFPSLDPIGKQIRVGGRPFQVIGIQEKQGSSFGASLDRYVWIPLLAFEKIWGSRLSVTIFAQPRGAREFSDAQEEAQMALRIMRRLKPNAADDFDILIPEAGRDFLSQLTSMIALAIVPITSVALVVAGIVVMNMMLVSVTERTREIGVRKSLGARRRDILAQILFESTLLTVLGGSIGLFISFLGTFGLARAFGTSVGLPAAYAALAVGISAAIGIGAGLYPAWLASRMPPVEALRSET
jgi:putative ABC transport system permease protein